MKCVIAARAYDNALLLHPLQRATYFPFVFFQNAVETFLLFHVCERSLLAVREFDEKIRQDSNRLGKGFEPSQCFQGSAGSAREVVILSFAILLWWLR